MGLSQDIRSACARPRWLTERIASLGKRSVGVPIQYVKDEEVGILPLKVIAPITDWKDQCR